MKRTAYDNQRGFIAISVAVLMIGIAIVSLLVVENAGRNNVQQSVDEQRETLAFTLQAGLEHARWQLDQNTSCTGYTDLSTTAFGDHSYAATVAPTSGSPVTLSVSGSLSSGASRQAVASNVPAFQPASTLILQPGAEGKDSFIEGASGHQDHNKGNDNNVRTASKSDDIYRALLQFDLAEIPPNAKVLSARLELYLYDNTGQADTVTVHGLTDSWVEDEVTWLERRSGFLTNWATSGGDYLPTAAGSFEADGVGWKEVEIQHLAQQWVSAPSSNHGMILRSEPGTDDREKRYYSSDATDPTLRPKFTVVYACECGQSCDAPDQQASLAHWMLNDASGATAVDAIGGYDGSVDGATWSAGTLNGALSFDGDNDFVEVPANLYLEELFDGGASVTAWIYPTGWGEEDEGRIVDKTDNLGNGDRPGWHLAVSGDNETLSFQHGFADQHGVWEAPAASLELNRWQHVAVVYDGSSAANTPTLFVDGIEQSVALVSDTPAGAVLNDAGIPLHLGNFAGATSRTFAGSLDEVRLFGSELSAAEVTDLAHNPVYCDAAYAPDYRRASFSDGGPGYELRRGISYFPENRRLGNSVVPTGGAWLGVGSGGVIAMTDARGVLLDNSFDTGLSGLDGIAYLAAGPYAGSLLTASGGSLHVVDPTAATPAASYRTVDVSALASSVTGVTYVDGGSYDRHVAILDGANREIYILDADWNEVQTINLGSFSGSITDVAHVRGSDNFLVVNPANDQVVMIDATETIVLSYDLLQFGYSDAQSIALHPTSCQHVVSDDTVGEFGYLEQYDGLVAHWTLDETSGSTAADAVGGHDGTLRNGPNWSANGSVDGALEFDGSNDYVEVAHDGALSLTSAFTISAWIYNDASSPSSSHRIISKEPTGSNDSYWLAFQSDTLFMGVGGEFFWPPTSFSTGRWYHIAASFDDAANEVRIHVDGTLVLTETTNTSMSTNGDPVIIGSNWEGFKHWEGLLDDVRLYDRALATDDIATLYSGSTGGGPTPVGACSGTFRDDFDSESFGGSNGTLAWATDWLEIGESNGAGSGDIQVREDQSEFQLRTRDSDNGGEGVQREVDLSGASAATLSYDYRRQNLDSSSDYTTVEISAKGAAGPWTELTRHAGGSNDSSYQPATHDIGAFLSANTRIRFLTSPSMGGTDTVWFDNVEISCSP